MMQTAEEGSGWEEGWVIVEPVTTPLVPRDYTGALRLPLHCGLVFSEAAEVVAEKDLKLQLNLQGWSYSRPDGTGFIEARHLHEDNMAVTFSRKGDLPFATVFTSPDYSSFLVRDGNYDPYCTVERIGTLFGWQMEVRPWKGNHPDQPPDPAYIVQKNSNSITVVREEEGKDKVEVARMVYGVPAKEHLAQGVAHSFVVQPGEDVGLMMIVTTATALTWHKGIPPNQTGTWADGVYTKGPPSDPGWFDLATSMVWGMAGPVAKVL